MYQLPSNLLEKDITKENRKWYKNPLSTRVILSDEYTINFRKHSD